MVLTLNRYDAYPYAIGAGTGISISIFMVSAVILTMDLIKWAEMSVKNINNAWGAIPLCWYSINLR